MKMKTKKNKIENKNKIKRKQTKVFQQIVKDKNILIWIFQFEERNI